MTTSTLKTIKRRGEGSVIGDVDESTDLHTIERACPTFFRTPHGKRETYDTYRGQLIVRNTVKFDRKSVRRTVVYLFFVSGEMKNDTFCISSGCDLACVQDAKRLIDLVLDGGEYEYGIGKD
jgi:hypothetical protein